MLQIIKKDGVEGYEKILEKLDLSGNTEISISEAVDGEKVDGYGIYELRPDCITIYMISDNGDLMLADGIIRSILFLAALKGVEKAVFEKGSEKAPNRLGILKDGTVLEPISDIFGGCEGCKHENDPHL